MALLTILRQFNWVDIFCVILLVRISYVALKNGLPAEIFRLLGALLAVYLSLHYYINFSDYIVGQTSARNSLAQFLPFLSFVTLAILGNSIFLLLGRIFSRLIHMEAVSNLNRWGSLILGIFRSLLLISLIMFMFVVAPLAYTRESVKNSYSGRHLLKVAPVTYSWLWNSIMSKFRTKEKFNDAVLKVEAGLTAK